MEFTISAVVMHEPHIVQDALLDPEFIATTANLPKIGDAELVECTRNGNTARLRVRYRFTAPLSSAITAVIDPDKLTWIDDATFDLAALRSHHVLEPDNYADRLTASYTSTLTAGGPVSQPSTRWTVDGSLDVHAALVGGRIAHAIVDGLHEAVDAQAALLNDWIVRRGTGEVAASS